MSLDAITRSVHSKFNCITVYFDRHNKVYLNLRLIFNSQETWTFLYNGDLQLFPCLDQLPHLGVPYPLTNGRQQLRHASGRCPVCHHSVTYIVRLKESTLFTFFGVTINFLFSVSSSSLKWWMLKAPPLISSDLHLLVL